MDENDDMDYVQQWYDYRGYEAFVTGVDGDYRATIHIDGGVIDVTSADYESLIEGTRLAIDEDIAENNCGLT